MTPEMQELERLLDELEELIRLEQRADKAMMCTWASLALFFVAAMWAPFFVWLMVAVLWGVCIIETGRRLVQMNRYTSRV